MTASPVPNQDNALRQHHPPEMPLVESHPGLAEIVPFPAAAATLGEVLAALTYALDLASDETAGHALRCCILGMNLGRRLRLQPAEMADLYYALLLNGMGTARERPATCEWMGMSETLCRHSLRAFDWTSMERIRVRFVLQYAFRGHSPLRRLIGVAGLLPRRTISPAFARRRSFAGMRLARKLNLPVGVTDALNGMDERWDGKGTPDGVAYESTHLLSQICCIAQDLAVFGDLIGRVKAVSLIEKHSGHRYDPGVAAAVITMNERRTLWGGIDNEDLMSEVLARNPQPDALPCTDDALEAICSAVAEVIDGRSRYTLLHSHGVADVAARIGAEMELSEREMRTLRCAALLHDIGKVSVPAALLDKEGPLTAAQLSDVRRSPVESYNILRRIRSFDAIALLARTHHERLDGSGYPDGLYEHQINRLSRILAVAESYDALSSPRPYREAYSETEVLMLLATDVPQALDAATVEALKRALRTPAR